MESVLQHHWQQLNPTRLPPSYRGGSLAFDKKRQQTVLVAAGETWLWNGTTWSEAQPHPAPSARNTAHLVYDSLTECILLFGGIGIDGTPLNDVWLWDGNAWQEQHPANFPFPVGGASLVCDAARRQVILFGGMMGFDGVSGSNRVGTLSDQTWLWDGTTWQALSTKHTPPARVGAQLVYDEARQQTLLFGGNGPTGYLNDMWLWQGDDWQPLSPVTLPPAGIRGYAAFHSELQHTLLLTEQVNEISQLQRTYQSWLWDGTSWTRSTPDQILPGSIEGLAYDEARGTIVACVVTGGKAPLADKSAGAVLPELAAPVLASQTWIW